MTFFKMTAYFVTFLRLLEGYFSNYDCSNLLFHGVGLFNSQFYKNLEITYYYHNKDTTTRFCHYNRENFRLKIKTLGVSYKKPWRSIVKSMGGI